MSERETTVATSVVPAAETRALADLSSLEQARDPRADLVELARIFDEEIAGDLQNHPGLVLIAGVSGTFYCNAIARLTRVTLRVARRCGDRGVPLDLLKRVYQVLEVPPRLAEFIERKLAVDGVGGVRCGRLYFTGTHESWARLAATRAG